MSLRTVCRRAAHGSSRKALGITIVTQASGTSVDFHCLDLVLLKMVLVQGVLRDISLVRGGCVFLCLCVEVSAMSARRCSGGVCVMTLISMTQYCGDVASAAYDDDEDGDSNCGVAGGGVEGGCDRIPAPGKCARSCVCAVEVRGPSHAPCHVQPDPVHLLQVCDDVEYSVREKDDTQNVFLF